MASSGGRDLSRWHLASAFATIAAKIVTKALYKSSFGGQFSLQSLQNALRVATKRPQKFDIIDKCFGELFCSDFGQDGKVVAR